MMKKILNLVMIFCVPIIVLFVSSPAMAAAQGEWVYSVVSSKATIVDYTGAGGNVTIPDQLGGYSVTYIGDFAFYGCTSLTSITIPDNVTSIGDGAFDGCTNLTSITIPNSVASIGSYAFFGCASLESIIVGGSNANYSSVDGVLYNKGQTELIQFPAGKSGEFTIPDSVTSIGYYAFESCTSLTSLNIPDSVTSIGSSAFYGCTGLESITIPNSVTSIGVCAFEDCTNLTSITIPNSVTSIGNLAFFACTGLTSIDILNSSTTIGILAFEGCVDLTIYGLPGSTAATYASNYNIPFVTYGSKILGYTNGEADVYFNAADGTSATVVIASYDDQSQLINIAHESCTLNNGSNSVEIAFEPGEPVGSDTRIYLWEGDFDNMKPLCPSYQVN